MNVTSGLPDILCIYEGRTIGIELKRPDGRGKPTEQQKLVLKQFTDHGAEGYLVDSIEQFCKIFNIKENER